MRNFKSFLLAALLAVITGPVFMQAWADSGEHSPPGSAIELDKSILPDCCPDVITLPPALPYSYTPIPVRMQVQNGRDYTLYTSANQLAIHQGYMPGSYGYTNIASSPNYIPARSPYVGVYQRDPREAIDRRRALKQESYINVTDQSPARPYPSTGPVGYHLRRTVLLE